MLTIPDNAPFTGTQKMWLKGFLAGIAAGLPQAGASIPAAPAAEAPKSGLPVTILWGSQTGTAETYAKKLAKALTAQGHAPTIMDMADATVGLFSTVKHLAILTSTYGDGEPPDNALDLHTSLHAETPALADLSFTVFALGDSNYPEFCKCGHDFQNRLTALGAKPLLPIMTSDVDHDLPFKEWSASLLSSLVPAH
ncbi:flavodoxin domain-containing protein [Luteolibacter sp. SL250]|uniref:flavodoxin domain-containing protein n=1 Tax=Luteolibacter sp. SL250 TaxID=2995170 RepID=UPI00226D848C|nr:flavodoxin domain-containing protein [Luteolibacter sp. SL250]WAC18263.1 flavodoxin domain-containing protein [Luteolibacter sp. SL250]